ncbi:nucleotide-binding domain-containing protein [Neoconidiobolus thromboides FSU 785]|nr:nucleotide-binding domain-containing protein [Neoconidiobolus thromboides FSU 785]
MLINAIKFQSLGSKLNAKSINKLNSNLLKFYSTTSAETPLSVAVVGAGPAGFYTAYRLLKLYNNDTTRIKIHIYDKYPTPYGLVRYGVAPDHPEVKVCQNKFEQVLQQENVNLYGNIELDKDIKIEQLQSNYNVVVLATGANNDKTFGLPGEESSSVLSARSFVGWYNGDPQYSSLKPNLDKTDTAIVLGQGNVALDIARILLAPLDELRKTDIAQHAVEELQRSKIKHVKIVGRRGPLQVSFTSKEFREMISLKGVETRLDETLLKNEINNNAKYLSKNRASKRLMSLIEKGVQQSKSDYSSINPANKICEFQFLRSPLQFITNNENIELQGIKFGLNKLEGEKPRAVPTGEETVENAGLAFRSIGYKSNPINNVPFDFDKFIIPNKQGCVIDKDNEIDNIYVSGWLKSGPVGVIATTMMNAFETAEMIHQDYDDKHIDKYKDGIQYEELKQMGLNPTNYKDWKKLDEYEVKVGNKDGKPREKVTNIEKMLDIIKN